MSRTVCALAEEGSLALEQTAASLALLRQIHPTPKPAARIVVPRSRTATAGFNCVPRHTSQTTREIRRGDMIVETSEYVLSPTPLEPDVDAAGFLSMTTVSTRSAAKSSQS